MQDPKLAELDGRPYRVGTYPKEFISLYDFATKALRLNPSPLLGAIYCATGGRPVNLTPKQCLAAFGKEHIYLPDSPREVFIRSGERSGKTTRLALVKALHAAIVGEVPLDTMSFERAHVPLYTYKENVDCTADYLKGYGVDLVKNGYVREVRTGRHERGIDLIRYDGRCTAVTVMAPDMKTERHHLSVVFDDAEMLGDILPLMRYTASKLVSGGQMWVIGTPAPEEATILDDTIARFHGARNNRILTVIAPAKELNQMLDVDGSLEREIRAQDPAMARRAFDAMPTHAEKAIRGGALDAATPIYRYANVDINVRKGVSSIAIFDATNPVKQETIFTADVYGGHLPQVVRELAELCTRRGVTEMRGDAFYADAIVAELAKIQCDPDVSAPTYKVVGG